jgi:hypothetical protein
MNARTMNARARCLLPALCLAVFCAAAGAQRPELQPGKPELEPPSAPTVTFTYNFPESDPVYFAVVVNALGQAAYESRGVSSISGEPREPFMMRFTISEENRSRIFELAGRAGYFEDDFNYRGRRLASMGAKTLIYEDSGRRGETHFNWSENRAVQELAAIFHRVSTTLESGRRLQYLRRFDRLGLDAELRFLERQTREKKVAEMHAIAPLLREIASDPAVMRVARERAQSVLRRAGEPLQEAPAQAESGAGGTRPVPTP